MNEEDKTQAPESEPQEILEEASSGNDQPPTDKPPTSHALQVWKGIGLLALLHVLVFVFPIAFFGIGIVQLIYLIPALILCRKNTGMVQGLLIGAGVTFLLNAACFGIVLTAFN